MPQCDSVKYYWHWLDREQRWIPVEDQCWTSKLRAVRRFRCLKPIKLDMWLMIDALMMGSVGAVVTPVHGGSGLHCTRRCLSQWVTQTSVRRRHMLCDPQYSWRMDVRGGPETSPARSGLPTDAVWVVVAEASAVCSPELCAQKQEYWEAVTVDKPRHQACAKCLLGEKGALAMASPLL